MGEAWFGPTSTADTFLAPGETVERDREAWKWSWGAYAENASHPTPTTGEMRKLTGKETDAAGADASAARRDLGG